MFICWLSPPKKKTKENKKKKNLHSTQVYQTRVLCNFCFFLKGTRAWYTRVLCCMVREFTKLEYHIIFFNRTNSNSAVLQWQNWWETWVFETRVLEKVVLGHLFPKQCFFAKNFQKMWYLTILASKQTVKGNKMWFVVKAIFIPFLLFCLFITGTIAATIPNKCRPVTNATIRSCTLFSHHLQPLLQQKCNVSFGFSFDINAPC